MILQIKAKVSAIIWKKKIVDYCIKERKIMDSIGPCHGCSSTCTSNITVHVALTEDDFRFNKSLICMC